MEKQKKIPVLRFPEFADDWQLKKIGTLTERVTNPVHVQDDKLYSQIGIRSHGKGIFYKEAVTGKSLGNKRVFWVKENTFIVNIVFAWEQAVAKTTEKETGMIASHRFPMYSPVETQSDLDYLLQFFLTRKGKSLLELASPGGAGRNKTLGQKEFENLKFLVPNVAEQTKIASFITAIDNKIAQLKQKKTLLEQYKKGVMQKIFSQELRFKDEGGKEFPDWEKKKLSEIAKVYQPKTISQNDLTERGFDVYGANGIIGKYSEYNHELEQIAITCRGNTCGTVNLTKSKSWITGNAMVINVDECKIIDKKFLFFQMKFTNLKYLITGSGQPQITGNLREHKILLPCLLEQTRIANFLSSIDEKINRTQNQIQQTGQYKKGLLQNMFV